MDKTRLGLLVLMMAVALPGQAKEPRLPFTDELEKGLAAAAEAGKPAVLSFVAACSIGAVANVGIAVARVPPQNAHMIHRCFVAIVEGRHTRIGGDEVGKPVQRLREPVSTEGVFKIEIWVGVEEVVGADGMPEGDDLAQAKVKIVRPFCKETLPAFCLIVPVFAAVLIRWRARAA